MDLDFSSNTIDPRNDIGIQIETILSQGPTSALNCHTSLYHIIKRYLITTYTYGIAENQDS